MDQIDVQIFALTSGKEPFTDWFKKLKDKRSQARIAERNGKNDDAARILRALSTSGSVLVPKPMVLLELANVLRQSDPKQASSLYEQIKKDYPNSMVADEADRGLEFLASKS